MQQAIDIPTIEHTHNHVVLYDAESLRHHQVPAIASKCESQVRVRLGNPAYLELQK